MLFPKTIKLVLAIALVSALVTVFSSTINNGRTAAKNPITRKMLRRHDKTKGPPTSAETAFLRSQEQVKEEQQIIPPRTFKMRDFKDMPLAVSKVKNLESDTWHQDLQIEVKNISTKPIYSILAHLQFPDDKVSDGVSGINLRFGERKYIDIRRVGDPQDPHLNPGDTYVFTIPERARKGLKIQHERAAENFKRLELHFGVISFGDGTGFEVGDFTDYRSIRIPAQNKNHHATRLSRFRVRSPPQDGCGSCSRYVGDPEPRQVCFNTYTNEYCDSDLATTAPWARCRRKMNEYWDCDGDGIKECYNEIIYDSEYCPGYSPTPTPTPTPSPSPSPSPVCDPAKKPNNSNCYCSPPILPGGDPYWSCWCSSGEFADYVKFPGTPGWGGCDPNKSYNNGGDCCICFPQQCPDGSAPNKYNCECPTPETPTPTPTPQGGGGGNVTPEYHQSCVDYDWVYWVSYDGGRTWNYDHSEYAGCFFF